MLHSTAVFPPIYNGLVCWEILNRILLFKSMFEEIWNRKINKINKSMFEMKVTGTQLWVLIFCKSCLRFGRSDVMKTFGMCGTYFPKYRTITSGNNFFFCCSLAMSQWIMVGSSNFYAESWREKSMSITVTVSTFSMFSLFQANLHLPLGSPSMLWSLSQRCYEQQWKYHILIVSLSLLLVAVLRIRCIIIYIYTDVLILKQTTTKNDQESDLFKIKTK